MSYGTGSATTIANLMSALMTFATTNAGMTLAVNRTEHIPSTSSDPADVWNVLALTKGTRYWWFRYQADKVFAMPGISSSGPNWQTIDNRPLHDSELTKIAAPFTSYHFFTEGTVVHAAIEMSSGAWTHINFGDVTKYAAWTGGNFLAITNVPTDSTYGPNTSGVLHNYLFGTPQGSGNGSATVSRMYLPYNSKNYAVFGQGLGQTDPDYSAVCAIGQVPGMEDQIIRDSPNAMNGRAVAQRCEVYLSDDAASGTGLWLPMGYIPNIRPINVRDLNAKDVVNTDWMVFPCQARNSFVLNQYGNSFNRGWAVRK